MKSPSPQVEIGQIWQDANGTARRVVEPLSEWEVHFARVVDGYRTKVQRVSHWGAPSGRYTYIPKEEPQECPVHIRTAGAGEAATTFCGARAQGLITTTLENLRYWRQRAKAEKRTEICRVCVKRATDGVHATLAAAEAA